MPITTKRGDKGETGLLGTSERVPKFDLRPETYGTVDELNSFLGMSRAFAASDKVKRTLLAIQDHMFVIGAELAYAGDDSSFLRRRTSAEDVEGLTRLSYDIEARLAPEPRFVIYGGTRQSSILDVARAVSRRAERGIARFKAEGRLGNDKILEYFNRLSDVLYLLARLEDAEAGVKPAHPTYDRKEEDAA